MKKMGSAVFYRRAARWSRGAIQVLFFLTAPSLFSSAFSGIKEIFTAFSQGAGLRSTPFAKTLLFLILFTVIFGRFFCGYACAFGAVGDWIYLLSSSVWKKMKKRRPWRIPKKIQVDMQLMKYIVLFGTVMLCFAGQQQFVNRNSPWTVFSFLSSFHVPRGDMAVGSILLACIVAGMAVQERFFCQFLCPMGAVFSLLPILPFSQLRRDKGQCRKGCSACVKICPVALGPETDMDTDTIRSGECIQCGRCIDICPKKNVSAGWPSIGKAVPVRVILQAVFLLAAALLLCGCGQKDTAGDAGRAESGAGEPVSIQVFAMDTYMTLIAYGDHAAKALEEAEREIQRIDDLVSTGDKNSEISRLNERKEETVSEETFYMIERAKEIARDTDGAFDISVYPIMRAWGFTDGGYRVPEQERLDTLLEHVHADRIECMEDTLKVSLTDPKMEIDLGGIAKGYTSDRVMEILRKEGVEHALINLGGNVKTLGDKPDGSDWNIAVTDPEDPESFIGGVETSDKAVITSGGYQRYFEKDGTVYHHIIDLSTGYPADSGLRSVTVIAEDGTLADGLSTSLFIMGLDRAGDHWRENAEMFDAVFVEDDGSIWITEGIQECFSSERDHQVIRRFSDQS